MLLIRIGAFQDAEKELSDAAVLSSACGARNNNARTDLLRAVVHLETESNHRVAGSLAMNRVLSASKQLKTPLLYSIWAWAAAALGDVRSFKKAEQQFFKKSPPLLHSLHTQYLLRGLILLNKNSAALDLLERLNPTTPLLCWELGKFYALLKKDKALPTGTLALGLSIEEIRLLKNTQSKYSIEQSKSQTPNSILTNKKKITKVRVALIRFQFTK